MWSSCSIETWLEPGLYRGFAYGLDGGRCGVRRCATSRAPVRAHTSSEFEQAGNVVKMMVPNLGEMKDEKHPQNGR